MSEGLRARLQNVFPPMYKEGEGLGYSFKVFLGRLRMLLIAWIIWATAACVCWFIVPTSLATSADWWGMGSRVVLVFACLAFLWLNFAIFRNSKSIDNPADGVRKRIATTEGSGPGQGGLVEAIAAALSVLFTVRTAQSSAKKKPSVSGDDRQRDPEANILLGSEDRIPTHHLSAANLLARPLRELDIERSDGFSSGVLALEIVLLFDRAGYEFTVIPRMYEYEGPGITKWDLGERILLLSCGRASDAINYIILDKLGRLMYAAGIIPEALSKPASPFDAHWRSMLATFIGWLEKQDIVVAKKKRKPE